MFRSEENRQNQDLSFDGEDNLEFTGATLKITTTESSNSGIEVNRNNFNRNSTIMDNSAVLSGADALSPISNNTTATPSPVHQITTVRKNWLFGSDGGIISPTSSSMTTTKVVKDAEQQPQTISTIDPTKPKIGSPRHFFCFRKGLFEQAVNDCINILLRPMNDTELQGSWLLTEITHWDHEKEKVVILTSRTLLVVKYDFIALRVLENYKISLNKVDTVVSGKLTYPTSSLVPHIEGLSNGVSALFKGDLLIQRKNNNNSQMRSPTKKLETTSTTQQQPRNQYCSGFKIAQKFDFSHFNPVDRNNLGVRLLWNKGQPLAATTSWNPFAKDIPWRTFTNHPLHGFEDPYNTPPSAQDETIQQNRLIYSSENFNRAVVGLFTSENVDNSHVNHNCMIIEEPIILHNYAGIGAVFHNRNNLGFFKVRGKFSF